MFKFNIDGTDSTGLRIGTLDCETVDIQTPTRAITASEIGHLNELGSNMNFPHKIIEISKIYKEEMLGMLTSKENNNDISSEVSARHKKQIEKFTKYPDKIVIFNPSLPKDYKISERLNKILIGLQIASDVDLITIQDEKPDSSKEAFEKRIKESINFIEGQTDFDYVEPMPVMRMDMKNNLFQEKLRMLIDNNIKCVNLRYSSYRECYPNFSSIRKTASNTDMFIHMSDITRTWHKKTSLMHALQPLGIDSFSLKIFKPYPVMIIKQRLARRFDGKSWGILNLEEHRKLWGDNLNCSCHSCIGKDVNSFTKVWSGSNLVSSAIKVHDAFDGYREMQNSRKAGVYNEFRKYAKSKIYARDAIKQIAGIDVNQRTLF